VSTKQQQIAELAKQSPHMGFTSLAHHIDLRWLHEAYLRVRPEAHRVDGQTVLDYTANLQDNLRSLLERPSPHVRAPPVGGAYSEGTARNPSIGIPTFEDKVLQRRSSWSWKRL